MAFAVSFCFSRFCISVPGRRHFCPEPRDAYSSFGQLCAASEPPHYRTTEPTCQPTCQRPLLAFSHSFPAAIELNLACLIYLINFFHFFVHWRMPIKLAVSAPQMLAHCCCCWLVWVLFQLLALCRLFFLISIVFKWLQFFFYPTERREREREGGDIVKKSESLPY